MLRAALQNGAPLADMEPGGLKLAVAGDAVLGPHLSRRVAGGARPKRKRSAQDQEAVRGEGILDARIITETKRCARVALFVRRWPQPLGVVHAG